jgi:hypothetical protein
VRRALVLVLLVACTPAPAEGPVPEGAACRKDDECEAANDLSCCSACRQVVAVTKADAKRRRDICAVVDCAVRGEEKCAPETPLSAVRAVCRRGACALESR